MSRSAPQSNQSDDSMGILWGIAAIIFVLSVVWYLFKAQIINVYLHVKLWEVDHLIGFFPSLEGVRDSILYTLQKDPSSVLFNDVINLGMMVGNYVRYPMIFLTLVLAAWIYYASSTRIYKHIYTMKDLIRFERTNWPQISPVLGLDLVKTDIDKGPWAMALTPMQFCKRHGLLIEKHYGPQEGVSRKEWQKVEVALNRGKASQLFALQLGPAWRGVRATPPHVQALFAVFAARIEGDTAPAQALLRSINLSVPVKLSFAGTEPLLKKHAESAIVRRVVDRHAYLLTVMAEMLLAARSDGVQGVADFLWLKPLDRRLWYMLNVVGRQTPFVEVAGPFAHWVAEKEAGHRLLVPMVEEATNALEGALKEIIYRPDDKEA